MNKNSGNANQWSRQNRAEANYNDLKRHWKGHLLFWLISAAVLAGGIVLIVSGGGFNAPPGTGTPWKSVLGGVLTFLGGICLLSHSIVLLMVIPKGRAAAGDHEKRVETKPLEALQQGRLTQERYNRIRRKEIVALVIVVILAVVMLAYWRNPFSISLAACMVVGAAGALVLMGKGKGELIALAVIAGGIIGLILAGSSKVDTSKRYTYFVNGIKVGEGNGAFSNTLAGILGAVALFGGLILGVAYAITALCSLLTRP